MAQLEQELAVKEEMFLKLQVKVQVIKKETKPSISIVDACTIIEANVVSTSSKNLSHSTLEKQSFGSFELHTRGIGLQLMKHMSYNGQELARKAMELKTMLKWNLSQSMKAWDLVTNKKWADASKL
jgi:hypothetical protein